MRPELAGALIRRARLEKNWSQEGLCRGICSVSWLSKIEAGREGADPELVSALFARLGLDMAERPESAELIGRCCEAAFSLDYEAWDGLLAELRAARLEKGPFCLDAELLGRLFSDGHAAPGWARDLEPALGPGQRALLYWLSGDFEALCRLDGRAFALYLRGEEAYARGNNTLALELLERACRLTKEYGGGSMTALPIIETQAGDVSAYIPTNVISITDGQIFLESSLFFSGHRPAVNVGLSVSRVGGAAQTKAMKKAVGTLRLDLAQYREMEVFTQFSSDLDEETKSQLAYGQSLMYILRQGRSAPLSQGQQIVTLVTAMAHLYQQVPVAQVCALRDFLLGEFAAQRQSLMLQLEQGAALDDELRGQINDFARTALEKFKRTGGR